MQERPDAGRTPILLSMAAVIAALLLYATFVALRTGLGDVYGAPAIRFLLEGEAAGEPVTELQWRQLEAALVRGTELSPGNPDYIAALGRLEQIRLTQDRESLAIEDVVRLSASAAGYYAEAAAIRPTWPYDWGDLAIEAYRVGNYTSPEYHQALVNTERFGPWKDDEQLLIAELGSDTLDLLSLPAQRAYLRTLDRALARQPAAVTALLDQYSAWEPACELLEGYSLGGEVPRMDGQYGPLSMLESSCRQRVSSAF